MREQEQQARRQREEAAKRLARQRNKAVTYIDDDGCEITVTAGGHVLYNASDWW